MRKFNFLVPLLLLSSVYGEVQKTDAGFAIIEYPAKAAVNEDITITVRIKADAATTTHLTVGQHALVGGQRQTGHGARVFGLTANADQTHVAQFRVPDVPGLTRIHYPVFLSPGGNNWQGRVAATEVGLPVEGRVEPAAAPPPAVSPAAPRLPERPESHRLGDAEPLPIQQPPLEVLSPVRGTLVLNGPWKFRPAGEGREYETVPEDGWGQIWVPGTWGAPVRVIPGLIRTRDGGIWDACSPNLVSAWYERDLEIPAEWEGRAIELDLARVSTEAIVYANGEECGTVSWPGGTVDLTGAVTPGETATIRVRVFAVETGGMELVAMGTTAADFMRPARLEARGLIGDVLLQSRPRGAHVSDVLVIPSVSDNTLTLRAELTGAGSGPVDFTARLYNEQNELEKTFTRQVEVEEAGRQTVELSWDWEDPRLWDIGRPNLYILRLEARGAGLGDVYAARFGFREFGIDGRNFVLNGRTIRLRPWMVGTHWSAGGGMREIAENHIATALDMGVNYMFIWPTDPERRGSLGYTLYDQWFDAADRAGMLISAPAPRFDIRQRGQRDVITWNEEKRAQYRKRVDEGLRRFWNHPSIVMWAGTANEFPLMKLENPRLLGRMTGLPEEVRDYTDNNRYMDLVAAGRDAIAAFKEVDPTRPFYNHHDAFVGEYTNFNMYLGLQALQEREDWFSAWAEHAEIPFASHEFGPPTDVQLTRSRHGHHDAALGAEPLVTEYAAIYLGEASYRTECADYTAQMAKDYDPQLDPMVPYGKWAEHWHIWRDADNHQALQALFIENTWKSWRTWGITGGLFPWYGTNYYDDDWPGGLLFRRMGEEGEEINPVVEMPPFEPGRRGPYLSSMPIGLLHAMDTDEGGYTAMPSGEALLKVNRPTLAWIAGHDAEAETLGDGFTDKSHHFFEGETLRKQIVLINDDRPDRPAYTASWTAEIEGRHVGGGEFEGRLASGETVFHPISFEASGGDRAEGVIRLTAEVGGEAHRDEFRFRVYARPGPGEVGEVTLFDPEGTTRAWLESLGYTCRAWDGGAVPLLIVGRNALREGSDTRLRNALDAYVRGGGRLLMFNQIFWDDYVRNFPEHIQMRQQWGLRTTPHVTRRLWPVSPGHPLTRGLDGEDFRDWRGAGTAMPSELYTDINDNKLHHYNGWRWGNRGSVASQALEKPHLTGWRPILHGEFDLAYTALMETWIGDGAVVWCTLDLEGREGAAEPMAAIFTRRLIDYAAAMPLRPTRPAGYVGGEAGRALFTALQVASAEPEADGTMPIVAGPEATEADLAPYTEAGNPILVLARRERRGLFGTYSRRAETFSGSLNIPEWPETLGISASDTRFRSPAVWWVLTDGAEIGADGLLARKRVGNSTVVFTQLDPEALDAEARPYFRYTRWRQHRAIANLLANLGADFVSNRELLEAVAGRRKQTDTLYLPGYNTRFVDGDDPYRWNTW